MQMPTQTIFDLIIECGMYAEYYDCGVSDSHMCNALNIAYENGYITLEERDRVAEEIAVWLGNDLGWENDTLEGVLELMNKPSHYGARLEIYIDWKNRPKIVRTGDFDYHVEM